MNSGECRIREFRAVDVSTIFNIDFDLEELFPFEHLAQSDFAQVKINGKQYPILLHWLEVKTKEDAWQPLSRNPSTEVAMGDFDYPPKHENLIAR